MASDVINTDTAQIRDWQSIITLIVFVLANAIVLFPFKIPVYVPRPLWHGLLDTLSALRIISPRQHVGQGDNTNDRTKAWVRLNFPMNFITAPLIGDLFLLAILAIGREEVKGGTIGSDNISPIDIMGFFITLAYIAISIDASGLIRWLAFKVLQRGGKSGHRLFFYLYTFFFALGSFIGNDPIILSGTPFLAYMTRVSANIEHPRAWIFTQFAIANIASAILVSSNPTNLVLAGAFGVKFIEYTANIIVPVIVTVIVLFPCLLYLVFRNEKLIPSSIKMHELSEEAKAKKPVNPNIPSARGAAEDDDGQAGVGGQNSDLLSLEEVMNPFLDKPGAAVGSAIMAATLITVLAINAASPGGHELPVAFITLPAAFVMLCWDLGWGWVHRHETREVARRGREKIEVLRADRIKQQRESQHPVTRIADNAMLHQDVLVAKASGSDLYDAEHNQPPPIELQHISSKSASGTVPNIVDTTSRTSSVTASATSALPEKDEPADAEEAPTTSPPLDKIESSMPRQTTEHRRPRATLVSLICDAYGWSRETFPTASAVLSHLPWALVPFAFAMFVLVQALVTKGWVQVFAHGWDAWTKKTGTVGSIGGMAFLSVILCNFSGTNIGTTILLSRVIQTWVRLHEASGTSISNRTFWATVYAMAIGVNYGAFSTAFSASLAGLLWRDILARKHIIVSQLEFARVNLPIITVSTVVGCAVLVGEVYIMRDTSAYTPSWENG